MSKKEQQLNSSIQDNSRATIYTYWTNTFKACNAKKIYTSYNELTSSFGKPGEVIADATLFIYPIKISNVDKLPLYVYLLVKPDEVFEKNTLYECYIPNVVLNGAVPLKKKVNTFIEILCKDKTSAEILAMMNGPMDFTHVQNI